MTISKQRVRKALLLYSENNGERHYRDDLSLPVDSNDDLQQLIGVYCIKSKVLYQEPAEVKHRLYKTPYLIYEVEAVKRTPETETEFQRIEAMPRYNVWHDEIWKCYTKFDANSHSDDQLIVEEFVDHFSTFFMCDHNNNLEKLINIHVWNGWRRTEIFAAIRKLLNLKDEAVKASFQREQLEWLRVAVNQSPHLLGSI